MKNNKRPNKKCRSAVLLFLSFIAMYVLMAFHGQVWAHSIQENYVWLNVDESAIVGRFELNTNDVREKLDIDISGDESDRLESLRTNHQKIELFLRENFSISDEHGELPYTFGEPTLFEESSEYIQLPYQTSRLPADSTVTIRNTIWLVPPFSTSDRFHRSLIVSEYNKLQDAKFGDENVAIVFRPGHTEQTLDLSNPGTILDWKDFVWQGIVHIGIGLDHILFIVVLLLSAVVRLENGKWVPVSGFKPAFFNTLKIVTIFTIAHSITLTLAALNIVNVPGGLVETIIAFSIIAMALNNLFPVMGNHSWLLIFLFGLFHGLGFASVMGELQFRMEFLERILIMFNIGVELGQLLLVVVLLPILFFLRKKAFYQPALLAGFSAITIMISTWWVLERTGLVA